MLLASGFWLLASGFWLLASGFWLLASGFWLLAFGFWLLILKANSQQPTANSQQPKIMPRKIGDKRDHDRIVIPSQTARPASSGESFVSYGAIRKNAKGFVFFHLLNWSDKMLTDCLPSPDLDIDNFNQNISLF